MLTADLLHRLYVTERLSVEATAAQLGYAPHRVRLAPHRVRLALDRPAIVARSCPRGNPGLPEKQAAAALRRTPSAQVGAALGVSAQSVLRRLPAAGLPVRPGGPPRRHRPRPDQLLLAEL